MAANYYYTGFSPRDHRELRLPRTDFVERLARDLMQELGRDESADREGKMYGVLLVETQNGKRFTLKAFSGLLNGEAIVSGWVPPIPGRDCVALLEKQTLARLTEIKNEYLALTNLPVRTQYSELVAEFATAWQELKEIHNCRKATRQQVRNNLPKDLDIIERQLVITTLEKESQTDSIERRNFKKERDDQLQIFRAQVEAADELIRSLKQERKTLSRQLQTAMHAAYSLSNFAGESASLQDLLPHGMPTGTGDCCAPKLLHYAAINNLKPLAMAEFWWGTPQGDKIPGQFYPACHDRCQPIMGFLLSGTDLSLPSDNPSHLEVGYPSSDLPIIYADRWMIAIDKPAGLLSVPGRYLDRQDSVLSRYRRQYPNEEIFAVHRLDRDTSGILLLARDRGTYRYLSQQFADREVKKVYEAILGGNIAKDRGIINLPLWGNPADRPRQTVDFVRGKESITEFRVVSRESITDSTADLVLTRIEFIPLTGRTHQLRVHAADIGGLGVSILGDSLYDCKLPTTRLHLHAKSLHFQHPHLSRWVRLETNVPFNRDPQSLLFARQSDIIDISKIAN
jgi:tRNA pseudouridine32 synthase/23S rRNA pseudouridine746 synthase